MLRAKVGQQPQILRIVTKARGNLTVVGFGDSAKTPVQRIEKAAKEEGFTMAELFGDRKIEWVGSGFSPQDLDEGLKLDGPYFGLRQYFDSGLVKPIEARLEKIEPGPSETQSRITLRLPDGDLATGKQTCV